MAVFSKYLFWLSSQAYATQCIDISVSNTLVPGGKFDVLKFLKKSKKCHIFDLRMIFHSPPISQHLLLFAAKLIVLIKFPTQMVITLYGKSGPFFDLPAKNYDEN